MNCQFMTYAAIMLVGTFISSVAQVLLKVAAQRKYDSFIKEYMNAPVIFAYAIFFGATFISIIAYRVVPLSMGPILEATGYIYVTIFGIVFFNERLNWQKALALLLIVVGIASYSLFG